VIQINYRDSRPIYEQIKDGIRKLIVQGIMESNEKLPSVRELATSLTINPNTIQRVYRELEAEGYVYTVKGKGCFVAGIPEENSARKSELLKQVADISEELKFMGTKKEDIFAVIDKVWNSK
jgi:transcriptional regulator, gntR family